MCSSDLRNPEVFLFDEPLSNLDAKLRVQMRVELAKLHRRLNTTIVYVTHDQVEAMTLGDRIVVMKDGIVQQVGTPMHLYERPANTFVGGFIGSPAMNQIPASLEAGHEGLKLVGEQFSLELPKEQMGALCSRIGSKIVLGIRPQDITPQGEKGDKTGFFAELEVIEPLGGES